MISLYPWSASNDERMQFKTAHFRGHPLPTDITLTLINVNTWMNNYIFLKDEMERAYHDILKIQILTSLLFVVHYADVIMIEMASQITSLAIVYSIVYSNADQRKHQSSASLAFVRGIHRRPVNSPHKWPVTRKMFPFDDVIMRWEGCHAE